MKSKRMLLKGRLARAIVVALLVLVITGTSVSFYYRQQTEQMLRVAIDTIPNRPKEAFDRFAPVLGFSNVVTLGSAERACDTFRDALMNSTLGALHTDPVTRKTFFDAAETVNTLAILEKASGRDFSADKLLVLEAVQGSSSRVLSGGTLSAWDSLRHFFRDVRVTDNNPRATMEPFNDWVEGANLVPRSPLAVRDAINQASDDFRRALETLELTAVAGESRVLQPMPENLAPAHLLQAELALSNGLRAIEALQPEIKPEDHSRRLAVLIGKLNYNIGVLRLVHRIDGRTGLRRLGSEYVVQAGVSTEERTFPNNEKLYQRFRELAIDGFFPRAYDAFANARGEEGDLPLESALAVLSQYHAAWFLFVDDQGSNPAQAIDSELRAIAAQGSGAEVLQALDMVQRPLLIVQVP